MNTSSTSEGGGLYEYDGDYDPVNGEKNEKEGCCSCDRLFRCMEDCRDKNCENCCKFCEGCSISCCPNTTDQRAVWFQVFCVIMMISSGLIALTGRGLLSILQGIFGVIFAVEGLTGFTTLRLDVVKRFRVFLFLFLIASVCIGVLNLATIDQYCETAEDQERCQNQAYLAAYILLAIGLPALVIFFCFLLRYIGQRDRQEQEAIAKLADMNRSSNIDMQKTMISLPGEKVERRSVLGMFHRKSSTVGPRSSFRTDKDSVSANMFGTEATDYKHHGPNDEEDGMISWSNHTTRKPKLSKRLSQTYVLQA